MFTKRGKYDKLMVTDDEIQRRIYPLRPFVIYSAWRECPETANAFHVSVDALLDGVVEYEMVQTLLSESSEQLLAQELLEVVKRYIR